MGPTAPPAVSGKPILATDPRHELSSLSVKQREDIQRVRSKLTSGPLQEIAQTATEDREALARASTATRNENVAYKKWIWETYEKPGIPIPADVAARAEQLSAASRAAREAFIRVGGQPIGYVPKAVEAASCGVQTPLKIIDELKLAKPSRFSEKCRLASDMSQADRARIEKQLKFLEGILPDSLFQKIPPKIKIDASLRRGRYGTWTYTIELPPGGGAPTTLVHELGHYIDQANEGPYRAAKKFYARRTAGEVPAPLGRGYESWEYTRKDKFFDPYVGSCPKDLPIEKHTGTEIVSMGLQRLIQDAAAFAKEDPEHFDLIVAILKGMI